MMSTGCCVETNLTINYMKNRSNVFIFILFLNNFLMFIFERERWSASRGGAERDGDTEFEAGSRL